MTDTHSHYDDEAFDSDRDELLKRLFEKEGLERIITAAVDIKTSKNLGALAHKYEGLYYTVGVHPQEIEGIEDNYLDILTDIIKSDEKAVAIGEIGLDYHYDTPARDAQIKVFEQQLDLAMKLDMPVVIHDRDAHKDTCDRVTAREGLKCVFHSFSGSDQTAAMLVKHGVYISFSGVLTFKNAKKTAQAITAVPDDRLLIETDCPYLAPHPFRGRRNDSSLMRYTLNEAARLRNDTPEHIEKITTENARRLFSRMK